MENKMKIIKYKKMGLGNYQIEFDDSTKLKLNEDIILKYNLLYKKEIDEYFLQELVNENNKYDIYNKCVKYIGVRLRSINEVKEYMHRKDIDDEYIEKIIQKLKQNKLLDDLVFTQAFIKDKLRFSTMGPYKIEKELKNHKIDQEIISKYISEIDDDFLEEKINKLILKMIKTNREKNNSRNRIYNNLLALGYRNDMIVSNLNKYNF